MSVDLNLIQQLREKTGAGMMDCKKALQESNGNIEEAISILRKKGAAVAEKRSGKTTSEGLIYAYIHPGSRIGVLIEINCETDFVARTQDMQQFAQDVCMHIVAFNPKYINDTQIDPEFIEREKDIIKTQLIQANKPLNMIESILQNKLKRVLSEVCLLEQQFVKNDQMTVEDIRKELVSKVGENIQIKRFARFELGA